MFKRLEEHKVSVYEKVAVVIVNFGPLDNFTARPIRQKVS